MSSACIAIVTFKDMEILLLLSMLVGDSHMQPYLKVLVTQTSDFSSGCNIYSYHLVGGKKNDPLQLNNHRLTNSYTSDFLTVNTYLFI